MKQVPYRGLKNIRRHPKEISGHGDLAPGSHRKEISGHGDLVSGSTVKKLVATATGCVGATVKKLVATATWRLEANVKKLVATATWHMETNVKKLVATATWRLGATVKKFCGWFADSWQAVSKPVWHIPLLCVQWKTLDDGQRNSPKYVEFYSKNKFEKLVHQVGFVIRIYHDAQSHERQIRTIFIHYVYLLCPFYMFRCSLHHHQREKVPLA